MAFNLWNMHQAANCWLGAACVYNMPADIKNSWWYPMLLTITMDQYIRIYQWFMSVDKDRSGTLELNELMAGQFPGGIRMSPQTALRMMRIFDTDFNGSVSFYEFMAMYKFMEVCYNLFVQNDKDRSGTMEPNEIKPALAQLGFNVNPRSATVIHRIFASGGRCDMNCWIALCAFCAQVRTTYSVVFRNPFYGFNKPFNPVEFGKFLDALIMILE